MTALIVDDTPVLRNLLRDILIEFCEFQNNDIYEATDGIRAMEEYKRIKPNIVFLDIAMPNLNGILAVQKLLEIDPAANIIMCTSAGGEKVVNDCIQAGAKDYLVKPLTPRQIAESVKNVLN